MRALTREDDRRRFSSFSEKRREKTSREEEKSISLVSYLEQLRRPGAEAVGLAQVEGAKVRIERLVDLRCFQQRGGGERMR